MHYTVAYARRRPELEGLWEGPAWKPVADLEVSNFRPESSDHRPVTRAKMVYDAWGIYGIFRVEDRYVRSTCTRFNDPVCRDSCVEFFVEPDPSSGYLNFEFNCGGVLYLSHVTDSTITPKGFNAFRKLTPEEGRQVLIHHSMPSTVDPERPEPVEWRLEFHVPFDLFRGCVGAGAANTARPWRANFYKCADATTHPHWAAWSPVDTLNFHLPHCFATLEFEPAPGKG